MNTPLFLMGSALIFWGWQVELLQISILVALILESSCLVKIRWQLSDKNYRRIMDICVYLFFAIMAFVLLSERDGTSVLNMFGWLPLILLPIMLAQTYGTKETINFSALSLMARRRVLNKKQKENSVNISFIYLSICLLSSGIGNNQSFWFYPLLFILVSWALTTGRNRSYPLWLWLTLLFCIGISGYFFQIGLQTLQDVIEKKSMELMGITGNELNNPFQTHTGIGSIGTLKLSNKIVIRVNTEENKKPPEFLRNATYNYYSRSNWYSSRKSLKIIEPDSDRSSWQILSPAHNDQEETITINTNFDEGEGILPIPIGTTHLANLPVQSVSLATSGSILLTGTPPQIHALVKADPSMAQESAPADIDLQIPIQLRSMLENILQDNQLKKESSGETLESILNYFHNHFSYSLVQKKAKGKKNALETFFTKTHAGHCEYFATASVMLARMAGIPARYVTGWVVTEYSTLEQCYLVRARHPHAWGIFYVNNKWQTLDTTPPNWLELENQQSSILIPIKDFLSWIRYRLTLWWSMQEQVNTLRLLAIPLSIFFIYCFVWLKRKRQDPRSLIKEAKITVEKRGIDSDFFLIEQHLANAGYGRHNNETQFKWLERLGHIKSEQDLQLDQLKNLLKTYYRYRFDPECNMECEKQKLKNNVEKWMMNVETLRKKDSC